MNKKGKTTGIKYLATMLVMACLAAMLCLFAGCTVLPAPDENQVALVGKTYYEDLGEAISSAKSGEKVTLFKDVDLSDTLVIENKKITLDLNGKTIYNTEDIWGVKDKNSWSLVSVREGGELTVTGNGKMLAKENDCYTMDIVDGGKLIVENGTFVGNITAVYAHTGTAEIKGGTYSLLQDMSYQDTVNPNKYLLNCLDESFAAGTASITVSGGTFDKFNPARSFEKDRASFLAEGYKVATNEDGTYTVAKLTEEDAVTVNGTAYKTVTEAIAAATDSDTVKLLKDVNLSDTLVIENKKLTLDLNGKTIYNTEDIWGVKDKNSWSLVSVRGTADVTITGNGKMLAKENDIYAFDIYDENAKLTIESGEFNGNISAVYVYAGTLTVKGGTFNIQQKNGGNNPYAFLLNCLDANYKNGTAKITVYGGTFYGSDPSSSVGENPVANFLADGYKSVANEDGTYTVVAE